MPRWSSAASARHGTARFWDQTDPTIESRNFARAWIWPLLKYGPSRAAAERALKVELANRHTPGGAGAIVASTHVSDLTQLWLGVLHGLPT